MLKEWSEQPEQVAYTRKLKQDRIRQALDLSCLGAQFSGRGLEDLLDQPELHRQCARYVQEWPSLRQRGEGLYFWGPVGSGKTHTAAVVVNELIEAHLVETLFLNVPEAAARLRQSFGDDGNTDGVTLVDRMKRVELLVLDDLGVERPSAWISELLYRVINERWRNRRPMIVTGELPPAKLGRRYRAQIVSRIQGCCRALELRGRDRRQRR